MPSVFTDGILGAADGIRTHDINFGKVACCHYITAADTSEHTGPHWPSKYTSGQNRVKGAHCLINNLTLGVVVASQSILLWEQGDGSEAGEQTRAGGGLA